jgi:solute carrier family 25 (mitochondrial aspartate/glutamate transporter), member 12/13
MGACSDWVKLYLGKKNGTHVLGCMRTLSQLFQTMTLTGFTDNEFTQLMKGLQGERLRQAFHYFDENQDGFIRPDQLKRIILVRYSWTIYRPAMLLILCPQELAGHKLSDAVIELLPTLTVLSPGGRISYSEVVACHNVIRGACAVSTLHQYNNPKLIPLIPQRWILSSACCVRLPQNPKTVGLTRRSS